MAKPNDKQKDRQRDKPTDIQTDGHADREIWRSTAQGGTSVVLVVLVGH